MAVIQKIRDQYGKIAGAIIAIALISFIISDARNGSFGSMFGGRDTYVASVDGTKIESKDYESRVKEYEILTNLYDNRGPVDEARRAGIREQVLNSMTYEAMVGKMCDKLGINISSSEENDLIYGMNAHPLVRQFNIEGQQIFNNEQTRQFDASRVKGLEEELKKNGAKIDPYNKISDSWNAVKNYVKRMARIEKFNNMLAGSTYEPKYLAQRTFTNQNSIANLRIVKVPYTAIPDAEAKVTDEDIKGYIAKHKGLFSPDQDYRSAEYVSFEIIPASADSMRAYQELESYKAEFATAKDDETFVSNKTEDPQAFSKAYAGKTQMQTIYADSFLKMPVGTVFGPYFENNSFRLTKVAGHKMLADSIKIRHILVRTKERGQVTLDDSAGKKRIDSIVAAIRSGIPFDSLLKLSDDDGSKNNKGEYWFTPAQRPGIDTNFANFAFEGHQGENKIVKGDNPNYTGYHYIEILEQKNIQPMVQLSTITKSLAPSDSTVNAIYTLANEFAAKSAKAADFDANAKKLGYEKRVVESIKQNAFSVEGIGTTREVIKWAYEAKLNDVSNVPFKINDERYVVCKLTGITTKNNFEITPANRPMLEQRVMEEKKGEKIIAKFKGANLETIAQNSGQQIMQVDSVTLGGNQIKNVGYEPKVLGYAFNPGFQLNATSPGIKGNGGVYFVSVVNRANVTSGNPMQDNMQQMQVRYNEEMQLRSYMGQILQIAMLKNADVKYKMDNF